MRAHVTKPFRGVEDGQVYPRDIAEGETLCGDLAKEAIAGGWAEEIDEAKALKAAEKARVAAAEKRVAELEAIAKNAKVDISKAKTAEEIEAVLKAAGVAIPA
jgi:phage terminase Nu1 subunit (DNA packaging protein)